MKDEIANTKSKQKDLFDERLLVYTMLTMEKKLKAESKIELRMDQLEGRVEKVEEKLQLLVNQAVHINELLLKLLEAQDSKTNDNKKGENDESLRKPQDDQTKGVQAHNSWSLIESVVSFLAVLALIPSHTIEESIQMLKKLSSCLTGK